MLIVVCLCTCVVIRLLAQHPGVWVVAVRGQRRVGDHERLQVEPAVCHKHQGLKSVLWVEHRGGATKDLSGTEGPDLRGGV